MMYFFSSDERSLYAEDVVDAVSLPTGLILHFRYRTKYIQDDLCAHLNDTKGKEGVIIFVNARNPDGTPQKGNPRFFPIRKVTVTSYEQEGERVHFFLELKDDLVDYSKNNSEYLQKFVENLPNRPFRDAGKEFLTGKFVLNSDNDIGPTGYVDRTDEQKYRASWEDLVDRLLESLVNNVFYRIDLYKRDPRLFHDQSYKIEPSALGNELDKGFRIESGREYYLKITYKHQEKLVSKSGIPSLLLSDYNGIITADQPRIDLGTVVDTQVRVIASKRSFANKRTSLQIKRENAEFHVVAIPFKVVLMPWLYSIFAFFFVGLILGVLTRNLYWGIIGSGISTLALFALQYFVK